MLFNLVFKIFVIDTSSFIQIIKYAFKKLTREINWTTMCEMTALIQVSISEGQARQPRPIDVSIEYLRSGRPQTTFARAEIKRVGRRIANVHVEAWQEARGAPIAFLRGHFAVTPRADAG